jgi:hypothetical protein
MPNNLFFFKTKFKYFVLILVIMILLYIMEYKFLFYPIKIKLLNEEAKITFLQMEQNEIHTVLEKLKERESNYLSFKRERANSNDEALLGLINKYMPNSVFQSMSTKNDIQVFSKANLNQLLDSISALGMFKLVCLASLLVVKVEKESFMHIFMNITPHAI